MTSLAKPLLPSSMAASRPGPKTLKPASTKRVGQPGAERRLGTDHHQARFEPLGQAEDAGDIGIRDRVTGRLAGDAGVAGSAVDFVHQRARNRFLDDGVFPAA